MYTRFFKRCIDLAAAVAALLVLSPLLLVIALMVALVSGGKVFFLQERVGKNNRLFRVVKFKTMNNKRNPDGKLLPDKDRITPIGKLLRSTSLDELPQLLNVLSGSMSLVGPRPLLVKYLPLYSERQARRHLVKPGITGWAQVNGRNSISWEEKFELDVWYVEHISLWLDTRIVWMTLVKIIKREGIDASGSTTMHPFSGS
jgi:lipopolysaccharide/colanic/teichoic acid biosynthesis glycosyltransferase